MPTKFETATVREYIKQHYPGCAPRHRVKIAQNVKRRDWYNASLGEAVGIAITNYVRHNLTHYETLMNHHGLTREEARIAEADAVADIVRSWRDAKSPADVPITALVSIPRPARQR